MIFISHRGNINGRNPERENSIDYIFEALNLDYDVEVDIWHVDDKWYLGHDEPKYKVDLNIFDFEYLHRIWFHCKNLDALYFLRTDTHNLKCFWHQNDSFSLISNRYIWTFPGEKLTNASICVLPEIAHYSDEELKDCLGFCSDYIKKYKNII